MSSASSSLPASPASDAKMSSSRVIFASFIGTAIEFYDFYVYATAAALVIGPVFFPHSSPAAQALSADRAVWRPTPDDGPSRRFRPTHVVQLALCCLVRAADNGLWYAGSLHPDTGEIHCTTSHGPDLAQAIEDF